LSEPVGPEPHHIHGKGIVTVDAASVLPAVGDFFRLADARGLSDCDRLRFVLAQFGPCLIILGLIVYVVVVLVRPDTQLLTTLRAYGTVDVIGSDNIFPTLQDVFRAYQADSGTAADPAS